MGLRRVASETLNVDYVNIKLKEYNFNLKMNRPAHACPAKK